MEFAHQNQPRLAALAAWSDSIGAAVRLGPSKQRVGIPEAWFLGPKAENDQLLSDLVGRALRQHVDFRRSFHPEDPTHITKAVQSSVAYRDAADLLRDSADQLFTLLRRSAPLASMRHQGHMLWDQAIPALIGYFGAMLYNQNNVAAEASPVTTLLEIEVGQDLCRMLGMPVAAATSAGNPGNGPPIPWGHITCDGSVANIEGLWAARNMKFLPVALRAAVREVPALASARHLEVQLPQGGRERLIDLDSWVLLNLPVDLAVGLPAAIEAMEVPVDVITQALTAYTVQNVGLLEFYRRFLPDVQASPVVLVPATRHYSWPKAGTLLGLGQNNVLPVNVDLDARMDVIALAEWLERCLRNRTPVLSVVAVIGSTEESAVDPLRDILDLRTEYRARGLDFTVHADAAWGGYFNTMLRNEDIAEDPAAEVPDWPMSRHVNEQYRALREADSVTVDPHKAGYVPYPAGAVCYRNAAMRDLISLRAPVIFHNQAEPTVGVYGVEGSKPGAAAAAVWLAHKVIRPDRSGYGRILGQCVWTSKRLYSRLVTLQDDRFDIVMFKPLPAEQAGAGAEEIARQWRKVKDTFIEPTNEELKSCLANDEEAARLFMELGSDQVILAFSLNFRDRNGNRNTDLAKANAFNQMVFSLCSMTRPVDNPNDVELILTSSSFDPQSYGQRFVDHYCRRLGVTPLPGQSVDFLISTTMDPWTTDTDQGNFLAVIEQALRHAAHQALDKLERDSQPVA